jgi:hypothetical protein
MKKFTKEEVESALDSHKLYVKLQNGRAWQARRNGKTINKAKNMPIGSWRIPVKYGFKNFGQLTPENASEDFIEIRSG